MSFIGILEDNIKTNHKNNWYLFLKIEKNLVEKYFKWIELSLGEKNKSLIGKGVLYFRSKKYEVLLSYSPFNKYRYDRIYINDKKIKFNDDIHLYYDKSLCLYHPIYDKPALNFIPLYKMIPWIVEWIVFYEQWKKYGVWLGNEIKH